MRVLIEGVRGCVCVCVVEGGGERGGERRCMRVCVVVLTCSGRDQIDSET